MEKEALAEDNIAISSPSANLEQDAASVQKYDHTQLSEETVSLDISKGDPKLDKYDGKYDPGENSDNNNVLEFKGQGDKEGDDIKRDDMSKMDESRDLESKYHVGKLNDDILQVDLARGKDFESKPEEGTEGKNFESTTEEVTEVENFESKPEEETEPTMEENLVKEESDPVFDGVEVPMMKTDRGISFCALGADPEPDKSVWPEKAMSLRKFVKEKGIVAVSSFIRALSGKRDESKQFPADKDKEVPDTAKDTEATENSKKPLDRSEWNPLKRIMSSRYVDADTKTEQGVGVVQEPAEPIITKGRIILYTRLGCQNCKEVRLFLYNKRLRYVEINIDVYPSRKLELEKFTGSCAVPKVFFNEIVIGGLGELKGLDESGKLKEKIDYLITEAPAYEAPLPPLSGEDDVSSSGSIDELALIVRKMQESIVVKDRFYKMRRFCNCFLGSEAINFLSEDQYLEREEAIEFARKLASKLFFRHVLDENLFEDGNHLYWFLDNDPIVSSHCYNMPLGIIEAKPKPIIEIASRLRFLSYAIFEAYTSEDGKHVDYRTIHGSEEFARYLRIIQELQRIEFQDIRREEKLAFFINLYNMMAIHAILVLGRPDGTMERRRLFGDFKYVIGGCTYSLSAIHNGILRANQRPPYNLMKPFGVNDKRSKAALPYPEPLIHFALVPGTRSGPALRCYSPANVDKELMDSARNFLRGGGLTIDVDAKVAYVSKILKWFSVDFGKNEVEILKHASNYLEAANSGTLLELLASGQLKVVYQHYDWGLNL